MNIEKYNDWINLLKGNPNKTLTFFIDGKEIQRSYHITELKKGHFETIDCGKKKNVWDETILQLWVPEKDDDGREQMSCQKALKITEEVDKAVTFVEDSTIVFEAGDEVRGNYYAQEIESDENELKIHLAGINTECKARKHRYEPNKDTSCGKPEPNKQTTCC